MVHVYQIKVGLN